MLSLTVRIGSDGTSKSSEGLTPTVSIYLIDPIERLLPPKWSELNDRASINLNDTTAFSSSSLVSILNSFYFAWNGEPIIGSKAKT